MAPGIVKVLGRFIRWSSVCDAPTQLFDSFDDALAWCEHEPQRENLRRTGTTTYSDMAQDDIDTFASWNRAGPNETSIGREAMISALEGMPVRLYVNGAWGWWKNTGRWEATQDPNAELALLRLELDAAPCWVPVAERLPEPGGNTRYVLRFEVKPDARHLYIGTPSLEVANMNNGGEWLNEDYMPFNSDFVVTHWLQLPSFD